jgi:hypothetical protein
MAFSPFTIFETKDGGTPMTIDTTLARPRSNSTHDLNCIDRIVLPFGYYKQVPFGKFTKGVSLRDHLWVQTIDETRRIRLEMLIKRHGGKLADLNEVLGYERTHSQLSRIKNKNMRTDRPGKFYVMGDEQAREIEQKLSLDQGWMDTPPSYAELHGENDPRTAMLLLMEKMPPDQWPTAVRLVDALTQPSKANGTTGQ